MLEDVEISRFGTNHVYPGDVRIYVICDQKIRNALSIFILILNKNFDIFRHLYLFFMYCITLTFM